MEAVQSRFHLDQQEQTGLPRTDFLSKPVYRRRQWGMDLLRLVLPEKKPFGLSLSRPAAASVPAPGFESRKTAHTGDGNLSRMGRFSRCLRLFPCAFGGAPALRPFRCRAGVKSRQILLLVMEPSALMRRSAGRGVSSFGRENLRICDGQGIVEPAEIEVRERVGRAGELGFKSISIDLRTAALDNQGEGIAPAVL